MKEYTFQELEYLISLIVLITGENKAENRSGMQRFLEVRKHDTLIHLQKCKQCLSMH